MAYERFDSRLTYKKRTPAIFIGQGKLRLNSDAEEMFRERGGIYGRLAVFWDKDKRKIALAIAGPNDLSAFKVKFDRSVIDKPAYIDVTELLKYIGWSEEKVIQVPLTWDNKRLMFEAKLPQNSSQTGLSFIQAYCTGTTEG